MAGFIFGEAIESITRKSIAFQTPQIRFSGFLTDRMAFQIEGRCGLNGLYGFRKERWEGAAGREPEANK
jgi:hypothetical protein